MKNYTYIIINYKLFISYTKKFRYGQRETHARSTKVKPRLSRVRVVRRIVYFMMFGCIFLQHLHSYKSWYTKGNDVSDYLIRINNMYLGDIFFFYYIYDIIFSLKCRKFF